MLGRGPTGDFGWTMIGPGGTRPPGIGIDPGPASTNTSSPVNSVAFGGIWRYKIWIMFNQG